MAKPQLMYGTSYQIFDNLKICITGTPSMVFYVLKLYLGKKKTPLTMKLSNKETYLFLCGWQFKIVEEIPFQVYGIKKFVSFQERILCYWLNLRNTYINAKVLIKPAKISYFMKPPYLLLHPDKKKSTLTFWYKNIKSLSWLSHNTYCSLFRLYISFITDYNKFTLLFMTKLTAIPSTQ